MLARTITDLLIIWNTHRDHKIPEEHKERGNQEKGERMECYKMLNKNIRIKGLNMSGGCKGG